MTRYTDVDALMKDFDGIDLTKCVKYGNKDAEQQHLSYSTMMMYEIASTIDDAPAADVVEVVHARWEERPVNVGTPTTSLFCTNCNSPNRLRTNFCYNCGAKMDEEES